MKRFDSTKGKYNRFFHATTNYIHRCHMDFTYKFINDQIQNPTNYDLDRDFQLHVQQLSNLGLKYFFQYSHIFSYFEIGEFNLFFLFYVNLHFCFDQAFLEIIAHLHLSCHGGKTNGLHLQHFSIFVFGVSFDLPTNVGPQVDDGIKGLNDR